MPIPTLRDSEYCPHLDRAITWIVKNQPIDGKISWRKGIAHSIARKSIYTRETREIIINKVLDLPRVIGLDDNGDPIYSSRQDPLLNGWAIVQTHVKNWAAAAHHYLEAFPPALRPAQAQLMLASLLKDPENSAWKKIETVAHEKRRLFALVV